MSESTGSTITVPPTWARWHFGILSLLTLFGAWMPFAKPEAGKLHPLLFTLLWYLIVGAGWVRTLTLFTSVTQVSESEIEFHSAIRDVRVRLAEIEEVACLPGWFLAVRHAGGRVILPNQFDYFRDFVSDVRRRCPSVVMRGV